ncbi:MAG TPA: flagellar biosynthetic protein FliO [Aliidongia sp.]|nr:flagellar biosynthetic protein FliO [Aliidongia sp.]
MRFVLSLIFVLALIGLFAFLLRRFGPPARFRRSGGRRLSVVEVQPIDARRRLVLVRRDDREHLLLLGIGQDLVVEAGIDATGRDFARHLPGEAP